MNLNFKDGVIVRDSVATDIEPISKNMRIADIQEIWRSHGHTPLQSLTIAFYTSTLCYTVEHNNKRAAMFGVVPESFLGSRGSIWLLGTNDLAKIQRKLIRHSRSVIKYLLQHYQHLDNYVDVKNTLSIKSSSVARRAALKLVRVFPEPVVCQIYPPLSMVLHCFAWYVLLIFHKILSVAAI